MTEWPGTGRKRLENEIPEQVTRIMFQVLDDLC
jgi:hypothetical protein